MLNFFTKSQQDSNDNIKLFDDPFNIDSIISVRLNFYKKHQRPYFAHIDFENNSTTGTQSFHGDSFDDLAKQIDKFVKSLKS